MNAIFGYSKQGQLDPSPLSSHGQVPWDSGTDITVPLGGSSNWLLLVAAADSPWASTSGRSKNMVIDFNKMLIYSVFKKSSDSTKWRYYSYHQLSNWMMKIHLCQWFLSAVTVTTNHSQLVFSGETTTFYTSQPLAPEVVTYNQSFGCDSPGCRTTV